MDAAPYSGSGCRAAGVRSAQAATTAARWAGVVPQHPPMTETPSSLTNWRWNSASCSGVRS